MVQLRRSLVAAAAALLVASPLAAQTVQPAGALPFRPGQWGAEFGVATTFPSVGLLRFRSERSAWLVQLGVSYVSFSDEIETPFDPEPIEGEVRERDLALTLGLRQYRPVADRVAGFTTFGAVLGNFAISEEADGQPDDETTGWQAGAFGELGGAWMVTPKLSLGASVQASLLYFTSHNEIDGQGEATRSGIAFDAGQTRLRVTLFF